MHHQQARLVQADGLDVLQRRGGGHRLEVMVEGGDAHARLFRQCFHVQRRGEVAVHVAQHLADAAAVAVARGQGAQRPALLAAQHAVDDLAHDLRAEHARLHRRAQRLQQADHGATQLGVERRGVDAAWRGADVRQAVVHLQQQLGEVAKVDVHRQAEQGLLRRGLGLALQRQRHRGDEVVVLVVDVHLVAEEAAFAALHQDEDTGLVHHRRARPAVGGAGEAHARQARGIGAFLGDHAGDQSGHALARDFGDVVH